MSCTDSCALFFKKKSVCVSDPCAAVGLNCRSYGAGSDVYDCQSWCCERDTSTLAVFVVVIIVVVICCVFCCAFAVYRFILRKRTQGDQQGIEEVDVDVVDVSVKNHRNNIGHQSSHKRRKGRGPGDSQDSTFTTSSYGGGKYRAEERSSSSQGKTNSGEREDQHQTGSHPRTQQNDEYDQYSESGYTAQSGRRDDDVMYDDVDEPETGFLDDATTASNRSGRSGSNTIGSRQPGQRKQVANLSGSDQYYEDQYSARSGQSGQGVTGKQGGVWNGDTSSAYFETPRSSRNNYQQGQQRAAPHSRSPRSLAKKHNSEDNLFNFDEDF
jgi:hypothetical protein